MLCSEGVAVNQGLDKIQAVTLKCRSWGCELCQPDRKRQLIAQAKDGAPTTFITLTASPQSGATPAERARALAKAWPKVVKAALRKYGYKSIPYICVFEATKKGEPHLHILCRVKWISQQWLSSKMKELTGSPIVWIIQVKSIRQACNYIAKYIGKEPHRFATCKRYWSTRSWRKTKWEPEDSDEGWYDGWEIRDASLEFHKTMWEAYGWVTEASRGRVVARAPPKLRGYPSRSQEPASAL